MDDAFKFWEKFQNIQLDLLLFVIFVFFAFKFKDVTDFLIRVKFLKAEQLKTAKELLELSGNVGGVEVKIINELMRSHAIQVATGLVSDKGRSLYCYLYVKFGVNELRGVNRTVPFVSIKDEAFFFDKKSLRKKRWYGTLTILVAVPMLMILSTIYSHVDGMNLSWLFLFSMVISIGGYFYWLARKIPDDLDIKNMERLLQSAEVSEFDLFLIGDYPR